VTITVGLRRWRVEIDLARRPMQLPPKSVFLVSQDLKGERVDILKTRKSCQ